MPFDLVYGVGDVLILGVVSLGVFLVIRAFVQRPRRPSSGTAAIQGSDSNVEEDSGDIRERTLPFPLDGAVDALRLAVCFGFSPVAFDVKLIANFAGYLRILPSDMRAWSTTR